MNPLSLELQFHVHNWLIISLKDFCIVIRKRATFWPSSSGPKTYTRYYKLRHRVPQLRLQSKALLLLKNYLHVHEISQYMYMQIENVKSCSHPVSYVIPQGSVLRPLLFNILINYISLATSKFKVIMYANDTTLVSHLENFGLVKC